MERLMRQFLINILYYLLGLLDTEKNEVSTTISMNEIDIVETELRGGLGGSIVTIKFNPKRYSPIRVHEKFGRYLLIDGYSRYQSMLTEGFETCEAFIINGGMESNLDSNLLNNKIS